MHQEISTMVDDFEDGRLDRRQLITRLAAVTTAAATAMAGTSSLLGQTADTTKSTFLAREVDHIALRVTDIARSRRFYEQHLGLTMTSCNERTCFLRCGSDFVALFKGSTPGLDHFSFGVDGMTADGAVKALERAGLEPKRRENRVYFDDPDGIEVQVSRT